MVFVPKMQALVRIVPVPGESTFHRVPLGALESVLTNATEEEIESKAKLYWEGELAPGPRTEVLFSGWYEIG